MCSHVASCRQYYWYTITHHKKVIHWGLIDDTPCCTRAGGAISIWNSHNASWNNIQMLQNLTAANVCHIYFKINPNAVRVVEEPETKLTSKLTKDLFLSATNWSNPSGSSHVPSILTLSYSALPCALGECVPFWRCPALPPPISDHQHWSSFWTVAALSSSLHLPLLLVGAKLRVLSSCSPTASSDHFPSSPELPKRLILSSSVTGTQGLILSRPLTRKIFLCFGSILLNMPFLPMDVLRSVAKQSIMEFPRLALVIIIALTSVVIIFLRLLSLSPGGGVGFRWQRQHLAVFDGNIDGLW